MYEAVLVPHSSDFFFLFLSRSNEKISRSKEKLSRSNEKVSCSDEKVSRSNENLSRSYENVSPSNEIVSPSNKKTISFEPENYLVLTRKKINGLRTCL